ncbi:hypothetical protein FRC17_005490 [Serendipita sp. 399]|nr:hypothetical protein FRC17_005490 [Serendipita sp. 399]
MSSTESESDVPEVISLKAAKANSREQSRRQAKRDETAARLKKEKNQARDARLKAEKTAKLDNTTRIIRKNIKKGKETTSGAADIIMDNFSKDTEDHDEERARLQARMDRAVFEAEQEGDSTEEEDGTPETGDKFSQVDSEEDAQMADKISDRSSNQDDEDEDDEDESSSTEEHDQQEQLDYLPDHYFTKPVPPSGPSSSTKLKPALKQRKGEKVKGRRRNKKKRQELVVGLGVLKYQSRSRTIRTLKSIASTAAIGRTAPTSKTNKFLKKTMKGDLRTRGWERRSGGSFVPSYAKLDS